MISEPLYDLLQSLIPQPPVGCELGGGCPGKSHPAGQGNFLEKANVPGISGREEGVYACVSVCLSVCVYTARREPSWGDGELRSGFWLRKQTLPSAIQEALCSV